MKTIKIIAEGGYQLPFNSSNRIKRHPTSTHKKFGYPYAIDWDMPTGTPILAARSGKVVKTESRFNTYGGEKRRKKGNGIIIEHDNNEVSRYWHIKWRGVKVKKGQKVKTGQIIGYSGQTGFASFPHLHFDVYKKVNVKVSM